MMPRLALRVNWIGQSLALSLYSLFVCMQRKHFLENWVGQTVSLEAVASLFPSQLHATPWMLLLCPTNVACKQSVL